MLFSSSTPNYKLSNKVSPPSKNKNNAPCGHNAELRSIMFFLLSQQLIIYQRIMVKGQRAAGRGGVSPPEVRRHPSHHPSQAHPRIPSRRTLLLSAACWRKNLPSQELVVYQRDVVKGERRTEKFFRSCDRV